MEWVLSAMVVAVVVESGCQVVVAVTATLVVMAAEVVFGMAVLVVVPLTVLLMSTTRVVVMVLLVVTGILERQVLAYGLALKMVGMTTQRRVLQSFLGARVVVVSARVSVWV